MELLGIFLAVLSALLVRDWLRVWAHNPHRYGATPSWGNYHPWRRKFQGFVRRKIGA